MDTAPFEPRMPNQQNAGADAEEARAHAFFPDLDLIGGALEASGIALWRWDVASNKITWSRNFEALHGWRPGSFDGTFSCFQQNIRPDDAPGVAAVMQEARQGGGAYSARYRVRAQPGRAERWIEASGRMTSAPAAMIGTFRDVTDQVTGERRLRARASRHQSVARLAERALAENDLQKLLDEAVTMIAEMVDVELVAILELIASDTKLLLRAGIGWKSGLVGALLMSGEPDTPAGFTLAADIPVVIEDLSSETRFAASPHLRDEGVVSVITVKITAPDGRVFGVLGAYGRHPRQFDEYDVSLLGAVATIIAGAIQRRQLDQRHELMIRELRHRSGNLFSQLLALLSQTASNSRNIADLVAKYQARVLALANAHRLITEGGWKSASLNELLRTLLAPYLDRVTLRGPNVFLEPDPAFALSTVVHEFATNATKFGSLSKPAGRLDVAWSAAHTEQGLTLVLTWQERNGPAPKRTRRPGFGTKLIDMVIRRQLNGDVQRAFEAGGLQARLVVPLTHERWPSAARAEPGGEPAADVPEGKA